MMIAEHIAGLSGKVYIDGRFRDAAASQSMNVLDPATENRIGELAMTPTALVDEAIDSARAAQKKWRALAALDRAHDLHLVADRMTKMEARLAEALTREMGKPYQESIDEVRWSAHSIRHSAEIARSEMGRVMGSAVAGQFHYTLKQPLGVAALIMPFNYPLVLLAWEAGAALASRGLRAWPILRA